MIFTGIRGHQSPIRHCFYLTIYVLDAQKLRNRISLNSTQNWFDYSMPKCFLAQNFNVYLGVCLCKGKKHRAREMKIPQLKSVLYKLIDKFSSYGSTVLSLILSFAD